MNRLMQGGGRGLDAFDGELAPQALAAGLGTALWRFECKRGFTIGRYYRGMRTAWVDEGDNLITTEGWHYLLNVGFRGAGAQAQISSWYVGLTAASPTPAYGDTLASHGGWTEFTSYSGNRKAYTIVAPVTRSITNAASKASFTMTGGGTVGGGFLTDAATGTSGILFSAKALTGGDRAVLTSDVLDVTVAVTMSST